MVPRRSGFWQAPMEDSAGSAAQVVARRPHGGYPVRSCRAPRPRSPPPCGPSQAGPQGGDSAEPRPPGFEVCTCFQNLTTFLPRRTPFWSVTLKATKLRSPPWTLVPTANNLVSFIVFFSVMRPTPSWAETLPSVRAGPRGEPPRTYVGVERPGPRGILRGQGAEPAPSRLRAPAAAPRGRPQAWV